MRIRYLTYAEWVEARDSFQTSPRNDAWEYQQLIIEQRDADIEQLNARLKVLQESLHPTKDG
jgi:hypothetical protein